jgi:hypothetical protein
LATAIAVRNLSYQLLLWIGEGPIYPSRVTHEGTIQEAAVEWLQTNRPLIPEPLRPPTESLGEFAAFFSTYLTSSFESIETRNSRVPVERYGCRCELCTRILHASNLRAKKVGKTDKLRADELMIECVVQLAREHGLLIDQQAAERFVKSTDTREAAAYYTYADWLIRRLAGESDGPSILALWRIVAWDPRGGMRPNFEFRSEDVRAAEVRLLDAMRQSERRT